MDDVVDVRKLISASAVVSLLTCLVAVNLRHIDFGFNFDTAGLVSIIATVNWTLWQAFKAALWKLAVLRPWLVKIPNLNGEWSGSLDSDWLPSPKSERLPSIPVSAIIKQSLTRITIDMSSDQMESSSSMGLVTYDAFRRKTSVGYIYDSSPQATKQSVNDVHYGATVLTYKRTKKSDQLLGTYWTGRKTKGDIKLTRNT